MENICFRILTNILTSCYESVQVSTCGTEARLKNFFFFCNKDKILIYLNYVPQLSQLQVQSLGSWMWSCTEGYLLHRMMSALFASLLFEQLCRSNSITSQLQNCVHRTIFNISTSYIIRNQNLDKHPSILFSLNAIQF